MLRIRGEISFANKGFTDAKPIEQGVYISSLKNTLFHLRQQERFLLIGNVPLLSKSVFV
jgi:hypothetical protein